jgi:hypothetical protein
VKNYSDRILAMSAITNCNIFGEGNALDEIANAINNYHFLRTILFVKFERTFFLKYKVL